MSDKVVEIRPYVEGPLPRWVWFAGGAATLGLLALQATRGGTSWGWLVLVPIAWVAHRTRRAARIRVDHQGIRLDHAPGAGLAWSWPEVRAIELDWRRKGSGVGPLIVRTDRDELVGRQPAMQALRRRRLAHQRQRLRDALASTCAAREIPFTERGDP